MLQTHAETAAAFAAILEKGEFAEPSDVAEFLVALLVDAADELLNSRDSSDYNSSADRKAVEKLFRRSNGG